MRIEVNEQEHAMVLDGLAALPLARSYNLFNKLLQAFREQQQIKAAAPKSFEELSVEELSGITKELSGVTDIMRGTKQGVDSPKSEVTPGG